MRRRYVLSRPVRVIAGVFGVLGLVMTAFELLASDRIDWWDTLTKFGVTVLFLYGAMRGESPAWLEPATYKPEEPKG